MELYFIDEHRPYLISYKVVEATADGHKILAHNASVRMLEIMTAAYPGCVHEMSESEYIQQFASRLIASRQP